jgi:hypothetical protein
MESDFWRIHEVVNLLCLVLQIVLMIGTLILVLSWPALRSRLLLCAFLAIQAGVSLSWILHNHLGDRLFEGGSLPWMVWIVVNLLAGLLATTLLLIFAIAARAELARVARGREGEPPALSPEPPRRDAGV